MFISSKIGKWFDDFVFVNCRDALLHLNDSFLWTELKISSAIITVYFLLFYRGFDIFSYPTPELWLIVRLHRRATHLLPINAPCHSAACNQWAQQKVWTAKIPHLPAPTTIIGIKEEMSTETGSIRWDNRWTRLRERSYHQTSARYEASTAAPV